MLHKILYSFPVQLLLHHIKHNQVLLLVWIVLTLVVTEQLGKYFGIPYLFLDPEYLNHVDFFSLFLMGISIGGLTMSYHITCYILDGFRFTFLGALPRPFTKFCLNNSTVPLVFILTYVIKLARYQFKYEFSSISAVGMKLIGFTTGLLLMTLLIMLYFQHTNRDIFRQIGRNVQRQLKRSPLARLIAAQRLSADFSSRIPVKYYLDFPLTFRKANYNIHHDREDILRIFDQNQLNAIIIQVAIFSTFILLGWFRDYHYVQIPAAAGVIILLSIVMMITGAISYWLRGWAVTVVVITIMGFTYFMNKETSDPYFRVFGISYNSLAEYSINRLSRLSSDNNYLSDVKSTMQIFENWKAKFPATDTTKKPKMIFLCISGGGQRASVWTMRCLQDIDSVFNGRIMKHTMLMTGASGGMLGAAYFRELYLRKQQGQIDNLYHPAYLDRISRNRLNPLVFSLIVGDLAPFNFQRFRIGNNSYPKDRGYYFERQLNIDTDYMMDKTISDYRLPEQRAQIPMMLITPTIVNDGRKLYISPQPISYLTTASPYDRRNVSTRFKGIEFSRFFARQNADSLRFMSALRMNASFPYIMPNAILPSSPAMEVMDAGLSDNFGVSDAVRFLYVFRDWISANTSGVVFICIRDPQKEEEIQKHYDRPMLYRLFSPIETLVSSLNSLQDIRNDNAIEYAKTWFKGEISTVDFYYQHTFNNRQIEEIPPVERASLSWRLTARELEGIKQMIHSSFNRKSIRKLEKLINEQ